MNITKIIVLVILTNSVGISLAGCTNKELEKECDNLSDLGWKKIRELETVPSDSAAYKRIDDERVKLDNRWKAKCMNR
jgi:hypothetical protein